jgi:hypothetical protein
MDLFRIFERHLGRKAHGGVIEIPAHAIERSWWSRRPVPQVCPFPRDNLRDFLAVLLE